MKEKIKDFEQIRKISLLCRLSLGNHNILWNVLSNNPDSIYPYTFIAHLDNYLPLLDNLLIKYKPQEDYHKHFLNSLVDKAFLEPNKNDELNQCNRPTSMLLELLAADYLSRQGEEILDLAAWTGKGIDIISKPKNSDKKYFTEVKYVGEDPERYKLTRTSSINADWVTSPATIYNYINIKIADSVFQFEKQKDEISIKERRVFIFVHSHPAANIIKNWFNSKSNWCELSWNNLTKKLNFSEEKSTQYLQNSAGYYHKKAGKLRLFLIDNALRIKEEINL
jgi:Holliday junction resolvase-like predicted endonuclease